MRQRTLTSCLWCVTTRRRFISLSQFTGLFRLNVDSSVNVPQLMNPKAVPLEEEIPESGSLHEANYRHGGLVNWHRHVRTSLTTMSSILSFIHVFISLSRYLQSNKTSVSASSHHLVTYDAAFRISLSQDERVGSSEVTRPLFLRSFESSFKVLCVGVARRRHGLTLEQWHTISGAREEEMPTCVLNPRGMFVLSVFRIDLIWTRARDKVYY